MIGHVLPDASRVELLPRGQLDLNGFNDTIGGLASNSATSVFLGGGTLTRRDEGRRDGHLRRSVRRRRQCGEDRRGHMGADRHERLGDADAGDRRARCA